MAGISHDASTGRKFEYILLLNTDDTNKYWKSIFISPQKSIGLSSSALVFLCTAKLETKLF